MKPWAIAAGALLAVVVLVHLPACFGFFVSDDFVYIEHTHQQPLGAFWTGEDRAGFSEYQPLTLTTFVLSYKAFGLRQFGYHAVNLVMLLLAVGALFYIGKWLTGSNLAGLAAAALFGLHPATAESVGFISNRGHLAASTLALIAVAFLSWALENGSERKFPAVLAAAFANLCAVSAVLARPEALWLALLMPLWTLLPEKKGETVKPARLVWAASGSICLIVMGLGMGALVKGKAGIFDLEVVPGLYILRNLVRALQLGIVPLRLEQAIGFAVSAQMILFPLALIAIVASVWLLGRLLGVRVVAGAGLLALLGFMPVMGQEPRFGILLVPIAALCLLAGALAHRGIRSAAALKPAAIAGAVVLIALAVLCSLESFGWLEAGDMARATIRKVIDDSGDENEAKQAYLVTVPDNIDGRFVLRNGVFQACRLFHEPRNLYVESWLSIGLGSSASGAVEVQRPLPTRFVVTAKGDTRYLLLPDGSRAHRKGDRLTVNGIVYQVLEMSAPFSPAKVQMDVPAEWIIEQSPDLYLFTDGRTISYPEIK